MYVTLIKTTQQPCRDKTKQTCYSVVSEIRVFACLRTDGGWIMRWDIGLGSNVPKAGYLCARSISFLLRLSPNGCTKEHKALLQQFAKFAFVHGLHLPSTLLYFATTCEISAVLLQHTSRCFSSLGYVSTNTPKPVKLSIFPNTGPVKESKHGVLIIDKKNVFLLR